MSKFMRGAMIGAGVVLAVMVAVAQDVKPIEKRFIIESQPLPKAVNVWADQAGMQVLWSSDARYWENRISCSPAVALPQPLSRAGS